MTKLFFGNQSEASTIQHSLLTGIVCALIIASFAYFSTDIAYEFKSLIEMIATIG